MNLPFVLGYWLPSVRPRCVLCPCLAPVFPVPHAARIYDWLIDV